VSPGTVVTLGEALVAIAPQTPTALDEATTLRMHAGGAEVNLAVGLARLGIPAEWVGRVGDDPLGRLVLRTLESEGVTARATVDPDRPTGLYLREWLPDGARRPYYYRRGSAGSALEPGDWQPGRWRPRGTPYRWLHVTGITCALGPGPRAAVELAVEWAGAHGCQVSLDPNHRPQLWSDGDARAALLPLVARCALLLLSTEDAELLFATGEPEAAIAAAHTAGARTVVLKRGALGAVASDGEAMVEAPPVRVAEPLDPVGAGDAFDAGFLAALLRGADLPGALALGAHAGARAVEVTGEHAGCPRLADLPQALRALLDPLTSPRG
jgi:2-dehydro-3-deoxygluconokinase